MVTESHPAAKAEASSPQTPDTPQAPATPHAWPDRLLPIATSFAEWLARPRVRLTVTGVILLLVGALFLPSSVWTLPLVIVGTLMVAIAWIGRRLDGRFAVEWGETGTQVEFRAKIKPAAPEQGVLAATRSDSRELEAAEVIEGEAHTVEIEIAELKALIRAAETAETAETAQTAETADPEHAGPGDGTAYATRGLRVANGGGPAVSPR